MNKLGIAAAVVIAVVVAGWLWSRSSRPPPATAPVATSPTEPPATVPTAAAASAGSGSGATSVRRISPDRRAQLLGQISGARTAGTAAVAPVASSGSDATRSGWSSERDPSKAIALDRDYIRSSVRDIIPLLAECYSAALARKPALAGSVLVSFEISGEPEVGGVITNSEVLTAGKRIVDDNGKELEPTTLDDAEVHECIRETMYAIEIDPPPHGGTVTVRYPLAFAPNGP
ncbi:MAG: hypothetical protein AB7O24_20250 [Kofleriaceae bacterium]